jgi:acylphosphatase
MPSVAVRITIQGRVHGVGFRAWVSDEAEQRGLSGWVRNRRDGTVEAVFSGPAEVVEELVARCGDGPPTAIVLAIESEPYDGPPPVGFKMLPTA